MKIDWTSSYKADGTPRHPPPNSLHGWLAKMRGTLAGNEELRSKGIREMRDARRYKEVQRARAKMGGGGGFLSVFSKPQSQPQPPPQPRRRLTREDRSMSYSSRKSHQSSSTKRSRPGPSRRSTAQSGRTMPGSYPVESRSRPTTQRKGSRR